MNILIFVVVVWYGLHKELGKILRLLQFVVSIHVNVFVVCAIERAESESERSRGAKEKKILCGMSKMESRVFR